MAEQTNISWTDNSFNPWWGCTKIAPGCDNCYAATFDHRLGGDYWNPHQKPRRTGPKNWKKVVEWNEEAEESGNRTKVFCGSMMDWCDKDAPPGAREDLFQLIKNTPHLDWQLLTKRATLIEKNLPNDWGNGYPNVWLGVTCENRRHGYPRIEALQKIPAAIRFISAEPLLEDLPDIDQHLTGINWIIIGGESGAGYRPMNKLWARRLLVNANAENVPVWFKQWGGNSKDKGGCEIFGRDFKQWPRLGI